MKIICFRFIRRLLHSTGSRLSAGTEMPSYVRLPKGTTAAHLCLPDAEGQQENQQTHSVSIGRWTCAEIYLSVTGLTENVEGLLVNKTLLTSSPLTYRLAPDKREGNLRHPLLFCFF